MHTATQRGEAVAPHMLGDPSGPTRAGHGRQIDLEAVFGEVLHVFAVAGVASRQRSKSRTALPSAADVRNHCKQDYAVTTRIAPSAALDAAIEELLAEGLGNGERLAEIGRLEARLVLQRAVEEEVTCPVTPCQ
jgi:hypothetical protein